MGRAKDHAFIDQPIADVEVFAAVPHVRPLGGLRPDLDAIGALIRVLLHDDGIGPGRNRRAREDPRGLARLERSRRLAPSRHLVDDGQHARRVRARPEQVPAPDGVAVHRRAVCRRVAARRHDRLGDFQSLPHRAPDSFASLRATGRDSAVEIPSTDRGSNTAFRFARTVPGVGRSREP